MKLPPPRMPLRTILTFSSAEQLGAVWWRALTVSSSLCGACVVRIVGGEPPFMG